MKDNHALVRFVRVSLLLAILVPAASLAQTDAEVNRDAREIFETVLSPYCPGRTISNCPSPQAEVLRTDIKEQLAAGRSPDDVKDDLYATFGDELRTVPRARGFGLLAWLVPGLGFVLGGWAVVLWIRRTGAPTTTERLEPELDPESEARLRAELAELDSL